jgi:hypothetical protein
MDVGFISLPADVLEHHLFPSLPLISVVLMHFVSQRCRNAAVRSRRINQQAVFLSLYSGGASIKLLEWVQQHLRYPLWSRNIRDQSRAWITLAAEGIKPNQVLYFSRSYFFAACLIGGHLHLFQHADRIGVLWRSFDVCSSAASRGHLELIKWAREHECDWNADTTSSAAAKGHLDLLMWLRENGCPWNGWTCGAAARGGHFEVLKWARANGCPWDLWTCKGAASGGHLEVGLFFSVSLFFLSLLASLQYVLFSLLSSLLSGSPSLPSLDTAMGERERLPIGPVYLSGGS